MPEQAKCQNKKQARKHNCLYIFLNFGQCSFYTSQKKLRAKKKGSISFHFLEALGKTYRTGKKERNGQGKGKSFVRGCEEGRLVPSPVFYIAGHPPTGQSNFYRVITCLYRLPPDPDEKRGALKKKTEWRRRGEEGAGKCRLDRPLHHSAWFTDAHFYSSVNLSRTDVSRCSSFYC